jgi:hypothetical protein
VKIYPAIVFCALALAGNPAHAQRAGDAVAGVPGAILIDRDSDGQVDGYLLDGDVHTGMPPAPPQSGLTSSTPDAYPEWGDWGRLAGTQWKDSDGTVVTYAWDVPGESMVVRSYGPRGSDTWRIGKQRDGRLVVSGGRGTITQVRPGYSTQRYGDTRVEYWFSNERITTTVSFKVFGKDSILQSSARSPATENDLNVAIAQSQAALAAKQQPSGPSMFEAMLRGVAIGLSGIDAPLMPNEGNTLDILNQASAALAQRNAAGQAQLNATIAQAQGQTQSASAAANPPTAALAGTSPTPLATPMPASGVSRSPKTFRAKFYAGYEIRPEDDHNTMCYSIFSFTIPNYNERTEGRDISAILDPMKSTFAAKCEAVEGQRLAERPMYTVEGVYNPLQLGNVRKGDHVVTMP